MSNFGFWEIFLIAVLIFLLFGANKFPSMMKNLAEGVKIFKKELAEKEEPAKDEKPVKTVAKKTVKKTTKSVKKPASKK